MIRQSQWAHLGASMWIAHSNESNVWLFPAIVTVNALSYSLPHISHFAMTRSR
jgi:hypothetical protein